MRANVCVLSVAKFNSHTSTMNCKLHLVYVYEKCKHVDLVGKKKLSVYRDSCKLINK
jgi:hypothetical protein